MPIVTVSNGISRVACLAMALISRFAAAVALRDSTAIARKKLVVGWAGSAVLALFMLGLWLTATLGLRPLLLPDEGRYASVAFEMLQGNSMVPTLNGLPFLHKPPLFYWVDMAAMHVFGVVPFAARAGSLVGAWLMGAALYLGLRRWHGQRVAVIALGVMATSPFFFVGAQYANHDMLVAGLITVAILAMARAVEQPPKVNLGWLMLGAVACALATLAKGLIGFVLPALVIGPWLLMRGHWRQVVGLLHPVAWIAFLVVAAPWFVVMQLRFPGFFDYFFVEQHFRRFLQSSFNNLQPPWFFALVLPALMLPWSAWIPQALRRAWAGRDAQVGLYAWWVLSIIGFFSFPSSKLVGYALPAVAPLCALLALSLVKSPPRQFRNLLAASAVACLAIVVAIAWQSPKSNLGAARALAAHVAPGDKVVMVDEFLYDVPFYAQLRSPVVFASDWRDPEVALQDNWRNELLDAAAFAPGLGQQVLQPLASVDALACGTATLWIPVTVNRARRVAQLTGATRVFGDRNSELWRVPARSC
jgi:4-amino-4-deoxy-L-arabinose transferase-like glycosyltransferase